MHTAHAPAVTGEGSSIAPVNDRMIKEASPAAVHFNVTQDWRTLGDYLRRLDERSHPAINMATFIGAGGHDISACPLAATPLSVPQPRRSEEEAKKTENRLRANGVRMSKMTLRDYSTGAAAAPCRLGVGDDPFLAG